MPPKPGAEPLAPLGLSGNRAICFLHYEVLGTVESLS